MALPRVQVVARPDGGDEDDDWGVGNGRCTNQRRDRESGRAGAGTEWNPGKGNHASKRCNSYRSYGDRANKWQSTERGKEGNKVFNNCKVRRPGGTMKSRVTGEETLRAMAVMKKALAQLERGPARLTRGVLVARLADGREEVQVNEEAVTRSPPEAGRAQSSTGGASSARCSAGLRGQVGPRRAGEASPRQQEHALARSDMNDVQVLLGRAAL
ncbi:unnamed protein product [Prorocentrum cordatum]|uniref:Uncharacterized protein n=1 Tax=Prorocentrum cordatum TaxID=2364126 RepID=A0ABN9XZW8_9DINO|nr:unnamed protein product [Polarella glacialis]